MDIYVYGNSEFKTKIHKTLDRGNIKFKIGDGEVFDLAYLEDLESQIKNSPNDIYLIDQTKIIYDDILSKYLKFLIPKDGISKKFLDEHGIGDISIRDFDDLIIYIEKRLEAIENAKPKAYEITKIDEMLEEDTVDALQDLTSKEA